MPRPIFLPLQFNLSPSAEALSSATSTNSCVTTEYCRFDDPCLGPHQDEFPCVLLPALFHGPQNVLGQFEPKRGRFDADAPRKLELTLNFLEGCMSFQMSRSSTHVYLALSELSQHVSVLTRQKPCGCLDLQCTSWVVSRFLTKCLSFCPPTTPKASALLGDHHPIPSTPQKHATASGHVAHHFDIIDVSEIAL